MGLFDNIGNALGGIKDAMDPSKMLMAFITPDRIADMTAALDKYLGSFELKENERFPELSINKLHGQWYFIAKTPTIIDGKLMAYRILSKMPALEFINNIMINKPAVNPENNTENIIKNKYS